MIAFALVSSLKTISTNRIMGNMYITKTCIFVIKWLCKLEFIPRFHWDSCYSIFSALYSVL